LNSHAYSLDTQLIGIPNGLTLSNQFANLAVRALLISKLRDNDFVLVLVAEGTS
jgi:hypothetical protein